MNKAKSEQNACYSGLLQLCVSLVVLYKNDQGKTNLAKMRQMARTTIHSSLKYSTEFMARTIKKNRNYFLMVNGNEAYKVGTAKWAKKLLRPDMSYVEF